jgi:hypothetical protein
MGQDSRRRHCCEQGGAQSAHTTSEKAGVQGMCRDGNLRAQPQKEAVQQIILMRWVDHLREQTCASKPDKTTGDYNGGCCWCKGGGEKEEDGQSDCPTVCVCVHVESRF